MYAFIEKLILLPVHKRNELFSRLVFSWCSSSFGHPCTYFLVVLPHRRTQHVIFIYHPYFNVQLGRNKLKWIFGTASQEIFLLLLVVACLSSWSHMHVIFVAFWPHFNTLAITKHIKVIYSFHMEEKKNGERKRLGLKPTFEQNNFHGIASPRQTLFWTYPFIFYDGPFGRNGGADKEIVYFIYKRCLNFMWLKMVSKSSLINMVINLWAPYLEKFLN